MLLRNQVEWALHCCAILAMRQSDAFVPTKDLAEFHGIPKEYLSKALQALSSAGILEGTLGPSGGYRLKKSPDEVSFLEVVEAIEGRQCTFDCTDIKSNNPCLKKGGARGLCAVARVMYRADEAWREELRGTSIAKLAEQLRRDIPADQLRRNEEWFRSHH